MIELYAYRLLNNYITENMESISWIDEFDDQYNRQAEKSRPFDKLSLFIEMVDREEIVCKNQYVQEGDMFIRFHLTYPKSTNYSAKKKNINSTYAYLEGVNELKYLLNKLDSSKYPSISKYVDYLLIQASEVYAMGKFNLVSVQDASNDQFKVKILEYAFHYADSSDHPQFQHITGWSIDFNFQTATVRGDFSSDYSGSTLGGPSDFDLRTEEDLIWIDSVDVSGDTLTINAQSYLEGVPIEMEYQIDGINWQSSNIFTGVTSGVYNIVVRDTAYRAKAYSDNPLII